MTLTELLLGLLSPIAYIAMIVMIGRWILGPVDRAACRRRERVQFTMADAFSLLFLLQLPLGAVHALASSDNEFAMWMRIFWCATCGTIWWTSVRTLSQAGVHKGWQRALFATVALPLAFVGSNAWAAIWVVLAFGLYEALTTSASVPFAMLVAINAALLAAFFAAARFTRRIVGETDLDGDSSPELERKPTASN